MVFVVGKLISTKLEERNISEEPIRVGQNTQAYNK